MGKNNTSNRVRLTNDSLNSYGTRVLTDGLDIEQYNRNPVLLWMHQRGQVIGTLTDIQKEHGEITGLLNFDEASELSQRCKKQWEFGSLRMVSVGIDILEWSNDPNLAVEGQTMATITKSKLTEVSVVDIGANDDAIRLNYQGQQLNLSAGGACPLPSLYNQSNQPQSTYPTEMDTKVLALKLGLPEGADETAIYAKIDEIKATSTEVETLRAEKEAVIQREVEALVDGAVAEKKIELKMRDHFLQLGKSVGADNLRTTFQSMSPREKLSATLNSFGQAVQPKTYAKLSDVPSEELMQLRDSDPDRYKQLYKAEYGIDCEL
jgi:hypothetical protein